MEEKTIKEKQNYYKSCDGTPLSNYKRFSGDVFFTLHGRASFLQLESLGHTSYQCNTTGKT